MTGFVNIVNVLVSCVINVCVFEGVGKNVLCCVVCILFTLIGRCLFTAQTMNKLSCHFTQYDYNVTNDSLILKEKLLFIRVVNKSFACSE